MCLVQKVFIRISKIIINKVCFRQLLLYVCILFVLFFVAACLRCDFHGQMNCAWKMFCFYVINGYNWKNCELKSMSLRTNNAKQRRSVITLIIGVFIEMVLKLERKGKEIKTGKCFWININVSSSQENIYVVLFYIMHSVKVTADSHFVLHLYICLALWETLVTC